MGVRYARNVRAIQFPPDFFPRKNSPCVLEGVAAVAKGRSQGPQGVGGIVLRLQLSPFAVSFPVALSCMAS